MNYQIYLEYAEYDLNYTQVNKGAGIYQCFCQENYKPENDPNNICKTYISDKLAASAFSSILSFVVSIVNIIIRTINYALVDYIGYDTESRRVSTIMTSIFFASLVNTGIIVLFTNAKLTFVPILNLFPINNQYTDFG